MTTPSFIQLRGDAVMIAVKVQPRASGNAILGASGNELRIKVAAPPVDSAANVALVEYVAEVLGCPRRCVTLSRGSTSRHKVLAVTEVPVDRIVDRLTAAPPA